MYVLSMELTKNMVLLLPLSNNSQYKGINVGFNVIFCLCIRATVMCHVDCIICTS